MRKANINASKCLINKVQSFAHTIAVDIFSDHATRVSFGAIGDVKVKQLLSSIHIQNAYKQLY